MAWAGLVMGITVGVCVFVCVVARLCVMICGASACVCVHQCGELCGCITWLFRRASAKEARAKYITYETTMPTLKTYSECGVVLVTCLGLPLALRAHLHAATGLECEKILYH